MFKFRLAPLLKFRKMQEEEKQRDLALAARELMKSDGELKGFKDQKVKAAVTLNDLGRINKDVNELKLYEDFIRGRASDIETKKKEVTDAREIVTDRQGELLEYVKRRRSLELYRERVEQRYKKEETRRERILMDELANQNWFKEKVW